MPESIYTRGSSREGWPPDEPLVGLPAVSAWYQRYIDSGQAELAMAVEGASYRASQAGSCLRQLQYARLGVSQTEPVTVADAWRFTAGHNGHELVQDEIKRAHPEAVVEGKFDFAIDEQVFGATHIDLLVPAPDVGENKWRVVEIKTTNGYAFKLAASTFRGAPEGPKFSHMRQLGLEWLAATEAGYDVVEARLLYLSMELLSPSLAADVAFGGEVGRFLAEWVVTPDELFTLARDQLANFQYVENRTVEKKLARRIIPEESTVEYTAIVTNPAGRRGGAFSVYSSEQGLVGGGDYWGCNYCGWQTLCASHPEEGSFE